MKTDDFDYELPEYLIAQRPLPERSASRMLVFHRCDGRVEHRHVSDLPSYLDAGDVVVVNDTRVIPARLFGERSDTGGRVELLLLRENADSFAMPQDGSAEAPPSGGAGQGSRSCRAVWDALYKASGKARPGLRFSLATGAISACILAVNKGCVTVALESDEPLMAILERDGQIPLPPYIVREEGEDAAQDRERYQTVFARAPGAVAAPTAGLHLTEALLSNLARKGVKTTAITLHVGPGTFRPVKADRIEDHVMDDERYVVSDQAVADINDARDSGGRVVAVGSTTVRTLETVMARRGFPVAGSGESDLFIRPPYPFRIVDAMLTNFHLPRSTLLMMVAAFCGFRVGTGDAVYSEEAGRERMMRVYAEAVRERYRFFSYGDCMLIL